VEGWCSHSLKLRTDFSQLPVLSSLFPRVTCSFQPIMATRPRSMSSPEHASLAAGHIQEARRFRRNLNQCQSESFQAELTKCVSRESFWSSSISDTIVKLSKGRAERYIVELWTLEEGFTLCENCNSMFLECTLPTTAILSPSCKLCLEYKVGKRHGGCSRIQDFKEWKLQRYLDISVERSRDILQWVSKGYYFLDAL
jgi:hypothetical protein